METVLISIICIALIVFGGMAMSQGFMTSVDASATGLTEIGLQAETLTRTELTPVSTNMTILAGDDAVDVIMKNTGQTKMADFDKWDVIVQYYDDSADYNVEWLPYNPSGASTYEWEVIWIQLDGQAETFEPNVLNPGEEIKIRMWLDPEVGADTTNLVAISTPSGVTRITYLSP